MRPISLCVMLLFIFLAILISNSTGHYVTDETEITHGKLREKRQAETLDHERQVESFDTDDDYPNSAQEDEPSFWDRVIKIAVKLFSRFVEWLNS